VRMICTPVERNVAAGPANCADNRFCVGSPYIFSRANFRSRSRIDTNDERFEVELRLIPKYPILRGFDQFTDKSLERRLTGETQLISPLPMVARGSYEGFIRE